MKQGKSRVDNLVLRSQLFSCSFACGTIFPDVTSPFQVLETWWSRQVTFAARVKWLWQPELGRSLSISPSTALGRDWPGVGPQHSSSNPYAGQWWAGQSPWLQVMSEHCLPLLCCHSVIPASLTGQEPEVPPAENWDLDPKLLRLSSAILFSKQSLLSVSKFPFQFFLENPAANGFKCSVCV